MPGIVGLVTKMPREWAEPQLLRMVEALRHEAFYRVGTWIDEASGIYVGWIVRENSFADGMPLSNERGDVVLVFSGEEFPEPGTAARLKQRGHALATEGPSYLVHLYEEDPAFPAGLNGRFHGLLSDRTRGTITLFNDRYGMHRIYYHQAKEAFYFAAEAKAILAVRPELRKAAPQGLVEFVVCGSVLENRTLFEGIHVLPGRANGRTNLPWTRSPSTKKSESPSRETSRGTSVVANASGCLSPEDWTAGWLWPGIGPPADPSPAILLGGCFTTPRTSCLREK